MNMQHIAKKVVAVGGSVFVVGMTVAGAFAYNLQSYPAKFIENGVFDGKIVVGEHAAAQDIVGSIDIAASLQGASVSKVPIPGAAGQTSLTGDAFRVETGSDKLELREPVGDVVDTITESDLKGLKSGTITTAEGTTDFHQYLRLKDTTNPLQNMSVNYIENDDNLIADYFVVDTSKPFLEWEIQFPQGLESKVETGTNRLSDIEDRTINIMGTDFNIVRATLSGKSMEMTLMGGSVADTMREGETKTYTIDGVNYEVTLVFVSDPNSGVAEAKFSVNGEVTQSLQQGDTDTLSGGLQIGVRDILVNSRDGVASFFLGADKVVINDNDVTNTALDGTIEVNNENIVDGAMDIVGTNTSSTKFKVSSIKYRLTMDAQSGSTAYVPSGHGLRELMRRPQGLLSDTLDIKYQGLEQVQTTDFKVNSRGDDRYEITFTNINGEEYTFPFLSNRNGVLNFGSDNDDLIIVEGASPAATNIGRNDYFIVTSNNDPEKSVSNVLRYETYDKTDKVLTLRDLASNSVNEVAVSTNGAGQLIVGGHTYAVNVSDPTISEPNISVDLNGDGAYGGRVKLTTWGGLQVDPALKIVVGTNTTTNLSAVDGNGKTFNTASGFVAGSTRITMSADVVARLFDTSSNGDENFNWTVQDTSDEKVSLDFSANNYRGPLNGGASSDEGKKFEFTSLEDNDQHSVGMTDYGILIDEYDPTSSNNPNELTLSVPKSQRLAQVFVTMGSVTATENSTGTVDRVNPIAVGLAVLDKDAPAMGTENLIVVGGPCANTVAAALLGNPANCADGFEPGKAMIRAWDNGQKVSILVAGYEAGETTAAAKVLSNYKDYQLSGSEVEVVAADLNSITVQAPTAMKGGNSSMMDDNTTA